MLTANRNRSPTQRPSRGEPLASVEVPSADPRPDLAVPGDALRRDAPFELRQAAPELPAGTDAELGEHLAQVGTRRSGGWATAGLVQHRVGRAPPAAPCHGWWSPRLCSRET